ncbi:MAG: DUF4320 family protein [Clostridium sp.]|nr:DUF4320 family protein [Clostridium sp.]
MKKKMIENKGAMYIETLGGFFIACIVLILMVNVVTALVYIGRLGTFSENVSKIVSREGIYNSSVEAKIEEYREESSLGNLNISLDGTEFMPGTKKIQMNDRIQVTVSGTVDVSFFVFTFKIPVENKDISRSEVYWRS